MTVLRSVAAMPDDIRQSSIQHCSRDVEGNWWEWCTHANRNILRPRCCHCLPSSLSVSKQTNGETASSWLQWCHFAHNSAPECGHSDPAAVQKYCYYRSIHEQPRRFVVFWILNMVMELLMDYLSWQLRIFCCSGGILAFKLHFSLLLLFSLKD